jgi:hypothetical protein
MNPYKFRVTYEIDIDATNVATVYSLLKNKESKFRSLRLIGAGGGSRLSPSADQVVAESSTTMRRIEGSFWNFFVRKPKLVKIERVT